MGVASPGASSLAVQSSFPVRESKAWKCESLAAAIKTSFPAVAIGPPMLACAGSRDSATFQLVIAAQRYAPGNLSRVRVHSTQLSPKRAYPPSLRYGMVFGVCSRSCGGVFSMRPIEPKLLVFTKIRWREGSKVYGPRAWVTSQIQDMGSGPVRLKLANASMP